MRVLRLDHVTVLSADIAATSRFYRDILGLEPGPRPSFSVRGAWLYCDDDPILHIVETSGPPRPPGPLDHVGFSGSGLRECIARLDARGIVYDVRRLPNPDPIRGDWQLFFHDPGGARVEMRFSALEDFPEAKDRHPDPVQTEGA